LTQALHGSYDTIIDECVIPADGSEDFSVSAKRLIGLACGG
jgi:hypothetical protein